MKLNVANQIELSEEALHELNYNLEETRLQIVSSIGGIKTEMDKLKEQLIILSLLIKQ